MMHITLNAQSWHSNYYRWIFGNNLPKVLCPYFWQMVFLVIVAPIIFTYRAFIYVREFILMFIPKRKVKPYIPLTDEQLALKAKRSKRWGNIAEIVGKIFLGITLAGIAAILICSVYMIFTSGKLFEIFVTLLAIVGLITVLVAIVYFIVEEEILSKISNSMVIQVPYQMIVGVIHKMCPIITWTNVPVEEEYDQWD